VNKAALVGSLVVVGGAFFWFSRRAEGAVAVNPSPLVDVLAEIGADAQAVLEQAAEVLKPGPWVPPARAEPYLAAIADAEARYSIPHNLLARLLYEESRYREDIITGRTVSSAGALGIAQFMPGTAAELGIDPLDPFAAIPAAARYLRRLYDRFGDWRQALAAYNWGQGNHERKDLPDGIVGDDWPAATRNYVEAISRDAGIA
jgi:soluble lytic murein transglycosylase-like protein